MHATDGGATRIYRFGCGQPVEVPAEAERQLALETEYWNALVAIEHEYRQRERAIWRSVEAVEQIALELERTLDDIAAARTRIEQARRDREAVLSEWREQATVMEVQRRHLQQRLYAAKGAHWDNVRTEIEALQAWRRETARVVYGDFSARGLYWGNSLLTRDRYEVARRRAERSVTKAGRPGALHERAFDGTGFWAVQLQHDAKDADAPCTMLRLFSQDSKWSRMLQIGPVDFSGWEHIPRGARRRRSRTSVRIRVASRGRDPVWLELPMVMHRPLPEDGVIKAAQVLRRRVGTNFVYALSLTVHTDCTQVADVAPTRTLAIALGWESKASGLRVAVCLGSDGSYEELVLPNPLLERFSTLDRLRSTRAKEYRAAAQEVEAWCGEHSGPVPSWLAEALNDRQKDAPETLGAVAEHWRSHRFPGDETGFSGLEAWRRKDKRLLEWEANLREKCIGFRVDLYRTFAHRNAGLYGRIVIHKPVLHRLRERPVPEIRDDFLRMSTRRLTQIAAVFTLERALEQAFAKLDRHVYVTPRGLQVWKHFACYDTHGGGGLEVVRCPRCSQLFDPELNTCRHLVRWAAAND